MTSEVVAGSPTCFAAVAEARVVVAAERHQVQVVIEDEARGVVVGDGLVDAPAEGGEERLGAFEIGDREVREEVHDSILAKSKCVVKGPPAGSQQTERVTELCDGLTTRLRATDDAQAVFEVIAALVGGGFSPEPPRP